MTTASNILQDLQSHAVALRQRGCKRIVAFLETATVQDAKPVLTDELLRKLSSLVTDLSPIVASLAMEFIDLLFQKLSPGKKALDDDNRVWLPSLTIVNQMTDALLCRLADAKAPIRAKAKATLTSVAMRTDVSNMLHKLHNLSTSRNCYLKRNILELMAEILSFDCISWSKEELFSCAKNVILTANVFLPQAHVQLSGELMDLAFHILEQLLHVSCTCVSEETGGHHSGKNNNVANMLALFGDLHVRTETLDKLHVLASQSSNHTILEKNNSVSSPEQPLHLTRQEVKVVTHTNTMVTARYKKASIDNFNIPTVCRFFVSEEEINKSLTKGLNFVPYEIQNQTEPKFVYLPKNAISLTSTEENLPLLEKMTTELNDEENWQKRYQSLQLLQSFFWGSRHLNSTTFSPCLLYEQVSFAALMRQLQDVIVLQLQDLRSVIVKEICRCLCVIVYQFYQYKTFHLSHANYSLVSLQKQNIFPLIKIIWPQVLKLLVSKTQIMSSSADMLVRVCLLASFDETNSQVTFNKWCTLIQDMLRSKKTLLHRYAMEYLLLVFLRFTHYTNNNYASTSPLSTNNEMLFLSCLNLGLSDAHLDVRKFARVSYHVLQWRDIHALGEELWACCDTDLDLQVLKQLKHSVKDEAGDLVLSKSCYGLTWAMLAYIRHARFSLYDVLNVHSSEEENDIEGAVVAAGNERNLFAGAENGQMYMEDDFDWMAAATSEAQPLMKMEVSNTALNTTTAPKVRMSMLSSAPSRPLLANAMPSAVSNNINVVNSTNVNASTTAKPSLLMGGVRRLSVATLPLRAVPTNNTTASTTSSLLGGRVRRMSFTLPPAGPSSMMPAATLPVDLSMVAKESTEPLFNDDPLANLEDTISYANTTSNMSSVSRRMSMVTSAKLVLQPVQLPVVSSITNVGDNSSNTNVNNNPNSTINSSSSAVSNKSTAVNGEENVHPAEALGQKAILRKKASVLPAQRASELDTFKHLHSNSATSAVNKVKLLDSFAQHMTIFFTRRNDATVEMLMETKEIVHLCFPVIWDSITDANVKLYTEAMRTFDACFSDRLFSETFLLPNHNNNNNINNNALLAMMCLKMFTALIDAKPVAKECINKLSILFLQHIQAANDASNNAVIHTVLKVLFSCVKDLPERALAAALQFAGALIPSILPIETSTVNMVPFVQEVVLRCMHLLVPNFVNLDVDLQLIATDNTPSFSTIPHTIITRGKTSNNAINSVKPSPVAMLAGKRLLVKLYEYVEASNNPTAKTTDSLFFKAVAGFSLAQQNVLKTLLVSLMPASQFDMKLTQQMKRGKHLLLLGSKKNNANDVAEINTMTKDKGEDNLAKTGDTDTLSMIVTQVTQQQPASVSPRVSPLKIESISPVNNNDDDNNTSEQEDEKLALLDAVVQQVCRSPSVTSSSLSPALSVMKHTYSSTAKIDSVATAVASPKVTNNVHNGMMGTVTSLPAVSRNSSVTLSPLVISSSKSESHAVFTLIVSDILSSPSTSTSTISASPSFSGSSPHHAVFIPSASKQQTLAASSPVEKADNVFSLLTSARKVSLPTSHSANNSNRIVTELLTEETSKNEQVAIETVVEKEEVKDFQYVKTQLLKLDVSVTQEINAEIVENALERIETLSLSSVQAIEAILLLLDTPLYTTADNGTTNNTTGAVMEKMHLVMSSLWDTCVIAPSRDNIASVLEKAFMFFTDYDHRKSFGKVRNALSEMEMMTVNFTLHVMNRFLHFLNSNSDDEEIDSLLLNLCRWLWAFQIPDGNRNKVSVAHSVLKLQLFACVLQQYPCSRCFGEPWDGLWQSVVVWASSPQILGHSTVTLVRQQATLCLARVFYAYCYRFHSGHGTMNRSSIDDGKERKEKCLQWFLPLTAMQRKLLMVYVEKFRAAQRT